LVAGTELASTAPGILRHSQRHFWTTVSVLPAVMTSPPAPTRRASSRAISATVGTMRDCRP